MRSVATTTDREQLVLNLEPAMPERWPTLRDFVRHQIETHPTKPAKTIAGDLDIAPSTLSRKLAPHEGDTQRFNCDDLERYIEATGDIAPIEYLAAKYMQAPEVRRAAAIQRVEALAGELERTLHLLKGKP